MMLGRGFIAACGLLVILWPFGAARCQPGDLSALLEQEDRPVATDASPPSPPPKPAPRQPAPSDDETRRSPIPAASALARATRSVAAIYESKAAESRLPAERAALALEMFEASKSLPDDVERYALLVAALNVGSKGDDVVLVQRLAEALANEFEIDDLGLIAKAIPTVVPPASADRWPAAADVMVATAKRCLDANRYDDATTVINAYLAQAKRAKDSRATSIAVSLRKLVTEGKKENEKLAGLQEAIKAGTATPEDYAEIGKTLCFRRGDWSRGLGYLARGDDQALVSAATLDLTAKTADQRMAVADAWAACVAKVPAGDRAACLDRAAAVYGEVIPKLEGLAKVRAQAGLDKALQSANTGGRDQSAWIVVFRSSKPDVWNTDSSREPTNFAVPLASVPANVKFLRIRRGSGGAVIVPMSKEKLLAEGEGGPVNWNGTKADMFGAFTLGVVDRRANVDGKTGQVAISRQKGYFSGWGFGHRVGHGGAAELCWDSQWIPREVVEIAVLTRPLAADEKRSLLE